ncbi:MAG: acyltransferase 3 [Phenylobacterium sp.]|nr:acyltransferase 3 [Phenylobacterium sp.]
MTVRTFEDQLALTGGRPSGFDYLRIVLSVSIVVWHTVQILGGNAAAAAFMTGPLRPLVGCILPAFFALSGFLVAGSFERNDLPGFLTLRGLRIFPALMVEVVISALLLGPLLTTAPWREYFTDPLFHRYFLNVTGWIHYELPGLFLHNPAGRTVNEQLWTVPFELECYLAIAAIGVIGLARRPWLFFWLLVAVSAGRDLYGVMTDHNAAIAAATPGRMLVLSFLLGVCLYLLRKRIPFNGPLFAVAVVLSWIFQSFEQTIYLSPLPVVYVTIYLGLLDPRRIFLIRSADYSYGIYLYGWPVQQAVAEVFPGLRVWWLHLPLSLALTGVCAYLSWHLVETHVLNRKKVALKAVASITARLPRWISLRRQPITETSG